MGCRGKKATSHVIRLRWRILTRVHLASRGARVSAALTYYLASEYGSERVRANCLAPGPVPTDLNRMFLGTEEGRAQTALWIPLGRVGALDDIANAAVFLASDEAQWISGAVLRVAGEIVIQ